MAQNAAPRKPQPNVEFDVPLELSGDALYAELDKLGIPTSMGEMSVAKRVKALLPPDPPSPIVRDPNWKFTWDSISIAVSDSLTDKLRQAFCADPDGEPSFTWGGHYAPGVASGFEAGKWRYRDALNKADRIVYFPDIPCVVTHPNSSDF